MEKEVNSSITWFPGHMQKAKREMMEKLKLVNIVYMVVDARLPKSSFNPLIIEVAKNKPVLLLLNKALLADGKQTEKWMSYYKKQGFYVLDVDAITGYNMKRIIPYTKEILSSVIEKNKARGIKMSMRAMITGIPNVGKSTIINSLAKKKIAQVGDRPGVTKNQQWVKLDNDIDLLDTPGVLWPKLEDNGFSLALSGAIKDDVLPLQDVVVYGFKYMSTYYKDAFYKKYNLDNPLSPEDIYEQIAKNRGCKKDDYERVDNLFLHDLRHEMMGRVTFDQYVEV